MPVLTAVASGKRVAAQNGDVNEADSFGLRPLHVAATLPSSNYSDVLGILIITSLLCIVVCLCLCYFDFVIESLFSIRNLNTSAADVLGQTPAHYAVLFGNREALSKLQSEGNNNITIITTFLTLRSLPDFSCRS